jgi:hypothetical protein
MTVEEFTIQVGALVIKAQASGLSVSQEISVLKGILDELKDSRPGIDSRSEREAVVGVAARGERRGTD